MWMRDAAQSKTKTNTMAFNFEHKAIQKWALSALLENTKVYKIRKQLFESLVDLVKGDQKEEDSHLILKVSEFQALKSYLTARNEQLNNPMELAFNKIVESLCKARPVAALLPQLQNLSVQDDDKGEGDPHEGDPPADPFAGEV